MSAGRATDRRGAGYRGGAPGPSAGDAVHDRDARDRLREDVESLAALERGSATAGERRSAAWVAERLAAEGALDPRVERFRYQSSYGIAHAVHLATGALAAAVGGGAGAVLSLAALASFELEFSGRRQWLRWLLPAGDGANAVARIPSGGPRRRTLVLVAHHDAARTGLIWHPRVMALATRRAAASGRVPSFAALPEGALATVAAGAAAERLTGRRGGTPAGLRMLGGVALAAGAALSLQVARGAVVPGAFDNATGVATMIELARRFAREPLRGTEVVVLASGCEEAGMGGMRAWLDRAGRDLDPARTLVLGLDGLGAGEPVVLGGEGPLRTVAYREADLELADRGARLAGVEAPRRWRIGGWSDPALAAIAGIPAISLMSVRDGRFPNYHLPSDTPAGVDWDALDRDAELAAAIATAFDAG